MSTICWKIKSVIETFINSSDLNNLILKSFFKRISKENVFFIEIGANDGIEGDPIYRYVLQYNLSGIYIEPQKKVFEKLVQNFHKQSNIYFENIAISSKEGEIELFIPKDNGKLSSAITSLMASTSLDKGNLGFFENYEIEKVKAKTFKYLIEKYDLTKKGEIFLLIDVEGNEKDIIYSIDFNSCKPKYIYFEHIHLTYDTHANINKYLQSLGYKIYFSKQDTLASLP